MYVGWKIKFVLMGTASIFYLMLSCLLTVTRRDARSLERRQELLEEMWSIRQQRVGRGALSGPSASLFLTYQMQSKTRSGSRISWCLPLTLRPEPGPLVALASFPGSGNTWVRYLLQQATGILTGSVYKDFALLKNGFPAETITNGSTIAIKTHEWGANAREPFQKAILLVRDPYAGVLAEYNRRSGGHIGHAGNEKFHGQNSQRWREFVSRYGRNWAAMNLDWMGNFTGPLLVVRYSKLCDDLENEMSRILKFLEWPISSETMECVLKNREGIYRRPKKHRQEKVLSEYMKSELSSHEAQVEAVLKTLETSVK